MDSGEVTLLVEDYVALKRSNMKSGGVAVQSQTLCPRCHTPMETQSLSDTSFFSCESCHGWWLPVGCLTNLSQTFKGAAVAIPFDEGRLYSRAQSIQATRQDSFSKFSSQPRLYPAIDQLWFWALFFSLSLAIGTFILIVGIRKSTGHLHWITNLNGLFLYLALGIVGGFGLLLQSWRVQHQKRMIEGYPTSTVRSLALGPVEVSGRAQPTGELLSSPFGALPCVFFTYVVEEQVQSDKNIKWKTIAKGISEYPFLVNDGTGRVLIIPDGAEFVFPEERTYRQNWLGALPPATVAGLGHLGISTNSWLGDRTLRCRETCILPEEEVYVLGTAHERMEAGHAVDNASRLFIGRSRDHHFIISDRSETELLSRLRWQIWGLFLGGCFLVAACLTVIFRYYLGTGS